jgi:uncharacterized protein (DUF4213/DUF364 family)
MDIKKIASDIYLATSTRNAFNILKLDMNKDEVRRIQVERDWMTERYNELKSELDFLLSEKQAVTE